MRERWWVVRMHRWGLAAGKTIVLAKSRAEAKQKAKEKHPDCEPSSASPRPTNP